MTFNIQPVLDAANAAAQQHAEDMAAAAAALADVQGQLTAANGAVAGLQTSNASLAGQLAKARPVSYTVAAGDTLSAVAKKLGVDDWRKLQAWNGLPSSTVKVGQQLLAVVTTDPAPAPDPTPSPAGTVFGLDVSSLSPDPAFATSAANHRKLTSGGVLPHVRVFSPGKPPAWSGDLKNIVAADRACVSFKSWDPAAFQALLDGIPADWSELWVCYRHEWEDDAKRATGGPTAFLKDYLATYAAMDAARKAHRNGPKVKLVKIHMWYQEVLAKTAGVTWAEAHGGQAFVDAHGWDCYSPTWGTWANRYATPQEFFDPAIAAAKATGVPWCVPELGATTAGWDKDGTARAKAVKAWCDYAKADGALWVNWWCSAGNSGESFHLENTPALAAWQQAMIS